MDTAMRDLERLEEQDERHDAPGRRLGTLLMAALATVGLVLAMGILLGGADAEAEAQEDPLSALDRAAGFDVEDEEIEEDLGSPEVDRRNLAFPETLSAYDTRPEVEAALAAAAAELEHPDPIPGGVPLGDVASGSVSDAPVPSPAAPPVRMPVDDTLPAALPASAAIGIAPEVLSRSRAHDPLVAAAFPPEAPTASVASGTDGRYTVQVISYQHPTDADVFAQSLRARGHHAFVTTADIPERGRFYRVRIGPFETQRAADAYRRRFEDEERMNTIVVRRRDDE